MDQLSGYKNKTGFSCQCMVDLQRIIACLQVRQSQDSVWSVGARYMSMVSKAQFSNRLLLAMGAQQDWRPVKQNQSFESFVNFNAMKHESFRNSVIQTLTFDSCHFLRTQSLSRDCTLWTTF